MLKWQRRRGKAGYLYLRVSEYHSRFGSLILYRRNRGLSGFAILSENATLKTVMKMLLQKNFSIGTGFKSSSARFLIIAGVCLGLAHGVMAQDSTNQPVAAVKSVRPENLSFAADEVVKLFNGGVEQKVIASYVASSTHPFQLDAPDIVYLHDTGISSELLSAMMRHDQEHPQPTAAATPAPAQSAPVPVRTYAQPTASAPTVVYTSPPVYQSAPIYVDGDYYPYSYPYYGYGYGVPFGVGIGFGFGRGGYGHGYGGYHGGGGFHGGGGGFHHH